MNITVLFFGVTRDLAKSSAITLELEEEVNIADVKRLLHKKYPTLATINSYVIAVNETYASEDVEVKENDVVAIIPPVSGG